MNAITAAPPQTRNASRHPGWPLSYALPPMGALLTAPRSLFSDQARLLITVYDQLPGIPEEGHPDDEAETGRGLALIATLGTWDWRPAEGGKVVRALLAAA